ncbi:MAG: hypothetical protein LBE62_13160, partial [Azonexus sp.]|nr:hypothetical protein [Azonexus sp.]
MNIYGMSKKGFHVNRPLELYERTNQFNIKHQASHDDELQYDNSLIRFNGTFIEYVDKWYSMRGNLLTLVIGPYLLFCFFLMPFSVYAAFYTGEYWFLSLFPLGLICFLPSLYYFLTDAFTYTHYPIRLNRKNRQVYAFRRDGTIFKAGWDDLYWTIYNRMGSGHVNISLVGDLNIMGHVLDKDGVTVRESIALPYISAGEPGYQNQLRFFEFARLYMEKGPGPVLEALKPHVLHILPDLDRKRETWFHGWQYVTDSLTGSPILQILFQVWFFPQSLCRWLVMRTSKIPQWPQWVEDECAVAPDDPW